MRRWLVGDSRKCPYHITGGILEFWGRGGLLDWTSEGMGRGRGVNAVWNSKRTGGFSSEFPEGEDRESFAWNCWSDNFSSLKIKLKQTVDGSIKCWQSCRWVSRWVLQWTPHQRDYSPLWKRVIAWERSLATSSYGIIWGDADRNKQEGI